MSITHPPSVYGRRAIEQSRRLGIHVNTIYRLIHRRGLPATLVGGVWYVRDEDLDAYFAAKTAARLGESTPAARPSVSSKALEADRALELAGW